MANALALYSLSDRERFPAFGFEEVNADRPSTLFYADFKTAIPFGISAVYEPWRNCGDLTKRDPKEVTELFVVVNHLLGEAWEMNEDCRKHKVYAPYPAMFEVFWRRKEQYLRGLVDKWPEEAQIHFYHVTD